MVPLAIVWGATTTVLVAFVLVMGVPLGTDAWFYQYTLWSLEHGNFVCAYPPKIGLGGPSVAVPSTFIAPLYPLLAGAVAWLVRLGSSHPFPTLGAMGRGCRDAMTAMWHWERRAHVQRETVMLSFVGWFMLVAGVVSHGVRFGKSLWRSEVASAGLVVTSLAVASTLIQYSHPQDLVATGLVWLAVAVFLRERWVMAGILLGLAASSNQVALLAGLVLVVLAERGPRWRLAGAMLATLVVVYGPLLLAGGTRSYGDILAGSGFNNSLGGTVVWELGMSVPLKYVMSRVLPLGAAVLTAWWSRRRHVEPPHDIEVIVLVTVGLCWRLVFEANLWGYYYVPVFVGLVILDRRIGHVRAGTVAWSLSQLVLYDYLPIGHEAVPALLRHWPLFLGQLGAAAIVTSMAIVAIRHRRDRGPWLAALAIYAFAYLLGPHLWHETVNNWPVWVHQLILVPWALGLALSGRHASTGFPCLEPTPPISDRSMPEWEPG